MIKRLIQLARLPRADRALLLEAVAIVTVAQVLIRVLRFSRLAPRLGTHMAESPATQDREMLGRARRIRWAIGSAARHLPWKPVCLPQALTAQWMLRRRGIPSTLYLGIDPSDSYEAHAWVRAGRIIVTGGPRQNRFAVVSSFA